MTSKKHKLARQVSSSSRNRGLQPNIRRCTASNTSNLGGQIRP